MAFLASEAAFSRSEKLVLCGSFMWLSVGRSGYSVSGGLKVAAQIASRCPRIERAARRASTARQPSAFSRSFRVSTLENWPDRARAYARSRVGIGIDSGACGGMGGTQDAPRPLAVTKGI